MFTRSSAPAFAGHPRSRASLLSAFTVLAFLVGLAPAAQAAGAAALTPSVTPVAAAPWVRVSTTAPGQLLTKLQAKLVSDFGQTAGSYDYSVVKKLRVSGTLNAQDYTDLRNATYAGTAIQELDLSGLVDSSTNALNGMTALTDVSLPPVGSFTLANPFAGDTNLHNVVVAAETYAFGSTTTFNGITGLQRITFLHPTKPSMNASTFVGSNNADPANRTVTAVVPDKTRGDYGTTAFTSNFAAVTETATADDLSELQAVIDEATAIGHGAAGVEYRWTLLQSAITAATSVRDGAAPSAAAVYGARLVLQTAITTIGATDLGLSFKVTHGAEVTLSWKNGTAQHYAEFTPHPVVKVADLSDSTNDVYVPSVVVPYNSQNIASAVIHGQTDKVAKIFTTSSTTMGAQYTLALTPLAGRTDTSLSIPGLGAGDNRGLYTNLDNTGTVNLNVGDHFDLDTFRTQQAQLDQVNNLFIEPDYSFDVSGTSVTTQNIGLDGRRQLRINAAQPGVSVVKISYGPLHYLTANDNGTPGATNWSFNGIDPQNTGVAVINVGGNVGTFDSGINVRNDLDTFYFDKNVGSRDYTFTPAAGTTVRVHDPLNVSAWGTGWHTYAAAPDGSFTVKLKGGRNIVELTNDGKVEYRVVRAKGVDVTVANTTNPGQPFVSGDNARISITGVEGGIEKLSGIYNPAFNAGTKGTVTYYDGSTALVSNVATQYQSATTTFAVNYTYTGVDKALNGDMFIGGLGADFAYHRQIPLEGKPANLAAAAIGPYHFGGMPTVYVNGSSVSTVPGTLGAPTGLQVTHGNASAQVSWTAPAPTSGLATQGYRVRYSSDGGNTWTTRSFGTGTSQTLTGLTNGTEYLVQVAAFNSASTGDYTTSQTVTPATVPGVPSSLMLTPHHTTIDVSWAAPSTGGAPITGYRVRYSSDSGQSWTSQDFGTATSQTLTGLSDKTSYDVQVAALNGEGVGDFTTSASATPTKTGVSLGAASASAIAKTSAEVSASVTAGDLSQDVTLEYSTQPDHSGAVTTSAQNVAASSVSTVEFPLSGLTSHTTYYVRVVATASDSDVIATAWTSFTTDKVPASVGTPAASAITKTSATITASVSPGDLAQSVTTEYSTHADHSAPVSSTSVPVAAGTPAGAVDVPLAGLASNTTYSYRVVVTASDNDTVTSDWGSFTTDKVPASLGTVSTSGLGTKSASVSAVVTPGDLAQDATVEYSTHADHTGAVSSPTTAVAGGPGSSTVTTVLSGLAPGTEFFYRVVLTASDGDTTTGSWASFTTAVPDAPTVSLTADASDLRVGDTVTLTWTAGNAQTLTAAGDWSGAKAIGGGTQDVVVTHAGSYAFSLTAAGEGGTTTGTVNVKVALAVTKLTVKAPTGQIHVGRSAALAVSGLAGGEPYRITIAGITVGTGVVPASGKLSRSVVVPSVLAEGTVPVAVLGSVDDRAGSTTLRIVGAKTLRVKVSRPKVAKGKNQRVTVSGLAAYEQVRIFYRGEQIAVLAATGKGTATTVFPVGSSKGTRTVKAYGITNDRVGARTFKVTK